jgi:2-phospho-L-lactate/phosphoenolpyruvate guanylyltransferase
LSAAAAGPRVFAAVPVKDLVNAKQRLVAALPAEERRALAAAMLQDVLDALAAVPELDVVVITRDADALALARRHGARCLQESANRGHTEAVAFAQREAVVAGARRFLTIPGDVPCATAAEVTALCDARAPLPPPDVVFVPSLSGFGTNAALLTPPDAMPLKFGEPSFGNHLDAARARGLSPRILRLPGIGLDVDAPEDLPLLLTHGASTRSAALLRRLGVPARLGIA